MGAPDLSLAANVTHWIAGRATPGTSGRTQDVINPASGRVTGRWRWPPRRTWTPRCRPRTPPSRHGPTRRRFAVRGSCSSSSSCSTSIATSWPRSITAEHGKVFTDAQGEVTRGIEIVEFACGIPQLLKGDYTEQVSTGIDNWTLRQPLGVVAGITPFDFPCMVPCWMYPVAIACGNGFMLKPSERDPTRACSSHELPRAGTGLPEGVFDVGAGRQGGGRCAAPRIRT